MLSVAIGEGGRIVNPAPIPDDPVSLFEGLKSALGDEGFLMEFYRRFHADTLRDIMIEIAEDKGIQTVPSSWSNIKLGTKNTFKHKKVR